MLNFCFLCTKRKFSTCRNFLYLLCIVLYYHYGFVFDYSIVYLFIILYYCLFVLLFICIIVCLYYCLFVLLFICIIVSLYYCLFVLLCCLFVCFFLGEFDNKALTFWLIADFNSIEGRDLAITAIEYIVSVSTQYNYWDTGQCALLLIVKFHWI